MKMRAERMRIGLGILAMTLGCGTPASIGPDSGGEGRDASVLDDGGHGGLDGAAVDGGPAVDAGPSVDGGHADEICTGGTDEDGDGQIDCADDACWSFEACIVEDVRRTVPDAVPCGDPITEDAAHTATDCAMIGMPDGSSTPTDCAAGVLETTARVFCDASGAAAAVWIEERLETPRSTRMLGARQFEMTYFERASVIDWERQTSGASAHSGGTSPPIHDGMFAATGESTGFRVITVRTALGSDTIARLLGMQRITSLIDLDLPMSMDTRSSLYTGGLFLSVPLP
jgi:hypothetical protein